MTFSGASDFLPLHRTHALCIRVDPTLRGSIRRGARAVHARCGYWGCSVDPFIQSQSGGMVTPQSPAGTIYNSSPRRPSPGEVVQIPDAVCARCARCGYSPSAILYSSARATVLEELEVPGSNPAGGSKQGRSIFGASVSVPASRKGRCKGYRVTQVPSLHLHLQVDHGVFPLLRDCKVPSLREALADIDLVAHARAYYWMCPGCGRPTSEPYYSHMRIKHPAVRALPEPPPPLCAAEVLDAVAGRPFPACTVYSMESPVYRACNRSMRDWHRARDAFATWQGFACLLDFELHQLKRFVGTVYRATPVQVPPSLYQKGNVVTWNHPSSTSSDARVAKMFLGGGDGGALKGSIFIIQSVTGRPIGEHSVYPREAEVLFRAGTQFQVKSQTPTGLKSLLESTMRCSLRSVDVYEVWRGLGVAASTGALE